ncbi:MAG: hypothetical protein KAR06_12130 [Deltaproteobacteria bacterium]|nr:hypothetical protein [Deltaproteobacteria bacterium]
MYRLAGRNRYHMSKPLTAQQYDNLSQAADCCPLMRNRMMPYKKGCRAIIIVDKRQLDRLTVCSYEEAIEITSLAGMSAIYDYNFLIGYIKEQSLRAGI